MDKNYKLTVGIPTFNRKDIVCEHVRHLVRELPDEYIEEVEFLVIDNNSQEKVYEALCNIVKGKNNFKIYKNRKNIGFARNFLKLFEKTNGQYLLLMSDEDYLDVSQLKNLLLFLKRKKPRYVACKIKSYRELCTHKINLKESITASAYFSEQIFHTQTARAYIKQAKMNDLIDTNGFIHAYIQVALANIMVFKNPNLCFYYSCLDGADSITCCRNDDVENIGGNEHPASFYAKLDSRLLYMKEALDFVEDLMEKGLINKNGLKKIANLYLDHFLALTLNAVKTKISSRYYYKLRKRTFFYFFTVVKKKIRCTKKLFGRKVC